MSDKSPRDDMEMPADPYANAETVEAMRCADCARSDSLDYGAVPVDAMPLTMEAMAGFPDGVPTSTGIDRRRFIQTGVLGTAAVYASTKIDWQRAFEAAVAEGANPQAMLVCIFLNGGNDGLNTFVPIGSDFATYQRARPAIARKLGPTVFGANNVVLQAGTTPIPGAGGQLGFANPLVSVGAGSQYSPPRLGLDSMWGQGNGAAGSNIALLPAADYNPPNLSHFESRDFWFAGMLKSSPTGWLGRWLDQYGSKDNPLQAVSIDSSVSKQIRAAKAPVAAVGSLTGVNFQIPGVPTADVNVNAEVAKLAGLPLAGANDHLGRSRQMFGLTVKVSNDLQGLSGQVNNAPNYPAGELTRKLRIAAQLLSAGLGTRIVTLDWGSFDTHGNQLASHDPQLATLAQALPAFHNDLAARGIEQNVITLVFSEFGRRINESDSTGTDHGVGGPMMVCGSAVRGGIAGPFPGLPANATGNLSVGTDFRAVYQKIIEEWLGGDPTAIVPGGPFPGFSGVNGSGRLLK